MAYYCNDCSYRGTTCGQAGECPACGSHDLSKTEVVIEQEAPSQIRLIILAVVWTILIALIMRKLAS